MRGVLQLLACSVRKRYRATWTIKDTFSECGVDKVGDDETCLITTCVATLSQFCGLDWKETVFVLLLLC